jgi:hypothetical protein
MKGGVRTQTLDLEKMSRVLYHSATAPDHFKFGVLMTQWSGGQYHKTFLYVKFVTPDVLIALRQIFFPLKTV